MALSSHLQLRSLISSLSLRLYNAYVQIYTTTTTTTTVLVVTLVVAAAAIAIAVPPPLCKCIVVPVLN